MSFLLEYDTGTEDLARLADKLDGYAVLASALADAGRTAPPLLFCFGSPRRGAGRPPRTRGDPGLGRSADRHRRDRPRRHQPGRPGLAALAGRTGGQVRLIDLDGALPTPGRTTGMAGTRTPRGGRTRAGAARRRRGRRARHVWHSSRGGGVRAAAVTATQARPVGTPLRGTSRVHSVVPSDRYPHRAAPPQVRRANRRHHPYPDIPRKPRSPGLAGEAAAWGGYGAGLWFWTRCQSYC